MVNSDNSEQNRQNEQRRERLLNLIDLNPEKGHISWAGRRAVLMRGDTFAGQRAELLEVLGVDKTRSLYSRLGYADGTRDAALAQQERPGSAFRDAFLVGPDMHAMSGMAAVETIAIDIDREGGGFYGEFLAHDSIEAAVHKQARGMSPEPVCWMQSGYASGFSSAFMGSPMLFREVECAAMGHDACRLIGKPLKQWQQQDPGARYYHPQDFVNRFDLAESAAADNRSIEQQLVGISAGFSLTMKRLEKVAPTSATVLLLGETGVGKEVFAKTLHRLGNRQAGPFIGVNCAALPAELVESELFGVERGGFTGAVATRAGRFERADGGTLFLDEVGSLSYSAQGKLLRVLQEREIERVGGSESIRVDVRVVAATNVDLQQAVEDGRFRRDLYYRLSVFPLRIPPLRERQDDIPLLMEFFRQKYVQRHQLIVDGFTQQAVVGLMQYEFPGNIRELENMVERGVILAIEGQLISLQDMLGEAELQQGGSSSLLKGLDYADSTDGLLLKLMRHREQAEGAELPTLAELEQALVRMAMEQAGGNQAAAARMIGLTRRQLAYRVAQQRSQ
ncbi:MAG: sigma 54-interacting transcriptional regulator [Immundisolibacteraceae bacterium]|nr:sigma 54-interacting transcriptional regulator [Immundisolibacteraceae bacterium]